MSSKTFGDYLRSKRLASGMSLRQLADQLGVSHVFLGEVERGVRGGLKRERWDDLVRALPGVSLDDLERQAIAARPLEIGLEGAPPRYQDLALALSRRIRQQDLEPVEIETILAVLNRGEQSR